MENQTTLNGKTYNNTTTVGVFNLSRKCILRAFYEDYSEIGLSLVELRKRFINEMSENTLSRSIFDLYNFGFIALCAKNVGPTKRRKYYKITEKGSRIWEANFR